LTQRNLTPGAACIVVNWNGGDDLAACLASLFVQTAAPDEVVLADNGSTDGSAAAAAARFPSVRRLDLPHNPGFGGAVNAAASTTSADLLVVLNPDVVLAPDWLATVASAFAADPRLGVAGAKLLFPDGRVQHAGGRVIRPLMLADHRHYGSADTADERDPIDVDYVTGAAIAIRRAAFAAVGGFDEHFFLYFEETDLCARVRAAGWRVRYLPLARAVHKESAVTGRESAAYYGNYHRGRIRYALKHVRAAGVLSELVPAERNRIDAVVSLDELAGLRHAFVDHAALLGGPDATDLAADQPELRPALAYALAGLAEHVVATVPSELRAPVGRSGRLSALKDLAGAARRLAELERRVAALERRADIPSAWLVEIDRDLTALARRVAADR
jgi:GT2 family glycosyltransferase